MYFRHNAEVHNTPEIIAELYRKEYLHTGFNIYEITGFLQWNFCVKTNALEGFRVWCLPCTE